MKQAFGFIVGIYLMVSPLNTLAMDFAHHMEIQGMEFFWTIDNDLIHVKLSAKTTGWLAVGFNPETSMLDANIIIGYVKNGKVKIEDHFGNRKRGHTSDKKQGGTDDIINPAGTEENGVTTIFFTIPLNSGDKYDPPIKADGSDIVIFAYGGSRDSSKSRHSFRTSYSINLATGEGQKQ